MKKLLIVKYETDNQEFSTMINILVVKRTADVLFINIQTLASSIKGYTTETYDNACN